VRNFRTNKDKRRAVMRLLEDPEWPHGRTGKSPAGAGWIARLYPRSVQGYLRKFRR
jgi:hypothetical protein